jgi:hypothetical protein
VGEFEENFFMYFEDLTKGIKNQFLSGRFYPHGKMATNVEPILQLLNLQLYVATAS